MSRNMKQQEKQRKSPDIGSFVKYLPLVVGMYVLGVVLSKKEKRQ